MNETLPPFASQPPQPKTSGLAIWSLVLGILSLLCFSIFAAIPSVICGHKALSRIKRSAGSVAGEGLAIAGLVTGYLGMAWAFVFIPMLLAIAIPNFIRARNTAQMNACINNLRQIDAAKQQWALENQKPGKETPTAQELNPYLKPSFDALQCPAGGVYTINNITLPPTCSITNHQLSAFAPASVPNTAPSVRIAPGGLRRGLGITPHGPPNFGEPPTQSRLFARDRAVAEPAICKVCLQQIDSAKRMWAFRYRKLGTEVPTVNDLLPFLPGNQLPLCPAHGTYAIGSVDELPTCPVPGHQLPGLKPTPNGTTPAK